MDFNAIERRLVGVEKRVERLAFVNEHVISQRDVLLAACEAAREFIRHEYESEACQRAVDAELGVSEWEAFMPVAWHTCRAAIAQAEEETQWPRTHSS